MERDTQNVTGDAVAAHRSDAAAAVVREDDFQPGRLITAEYAAQSSRKRAKDQTMQVRIGVLQRNEVYRTVFITYIIDFREYIRGYITSPATHDIFLHNSPHYHLYNFIKREDAVYMGTRYRRTALTVHDNQWPTIKLMAKELHIPEIYALLRLMPDE